MRSHVLSVLVVLPLLSCSDGGGEDAASRTAEVEGDRFETHVAAHRDHLVASIAAQARQVLDLPEETEIEVEVHESGTAPDGEGRLVYRLVVRSADGFHSAYQGRQSFQPRGSTWETEWADGRFEEGSDEFLAGPCWMRRVSATRNPIGFAPKGGESLGGDLGGESRSRTEGQQTLREQDLGLKDLQSDPQPVMRLLGTTDPDDGKSAEEKTRWEWLETRGDLALQLVPERTESSGRTFELGAVAFPPETPAFAAVRRLAAEAIESAVAGRLLTVRRSGDERWQIETGAGSLGAALVSKGLAYVDLTVGGGLSDPERQALLEAQRRAAGEGLGLWGPVAPGAGSWLLDPGGIHRPGCPDAAPGATPEADVLGALGTGARPCRACLARIEESPTAGGR